MKIYAFDAIQMQEITNSEVKGLFVDGHLDLYIFYRRNTLAYLPLKTSILLSRKETTDEDTLWVIL